MIRVDIPGSKSITQRALICAALASGKSIIYNPLLSEDTALLSEGIRSLGIEVQLSKNTFYISGNSGKFADKGEVSIFMGNNGTGFRFLTTLANFYPSDVTIMGDKRMQSRPVGDLVNSLNHFGFDISYLKDSNFPPIKISNYNILPNQITIDAAKSSQFVSSLLLSGVLFPDRFRIEVLDKLVSAPYIEITLSVMRDFSVDVERNGNIFIFPKNSSYLGREFTVESDFSSASYFIASSFFSDKTIFINNLRYDSSLQGDKRFIDIVKMMGATIKTSSNHIEIYPSQLYGVEVDMSDIPDMVPTLAVLASISSGETVIKNIEHLRYKESDRIEVTVKNLNKVGINAESGQDFIKIEGCRNYKKIRSCTIDPENDHRIAMSFSLFSLINKGVSISDKGCVKKSFPSYWEEFEKLE